MNRTRRSTSTLSIFLTALLSACGAEEPMQRADPIEADFVLSVFELEATASGPCPALSGLQSEALVEGGWQVAFPTQEELLSVLDCRWEGEDVLYESTGRLLGGEQNRIGWEFFSKRTTTGGLEYAISGRGEGDAFVGLRGEEHVALIDLEAQHKSSNHSIQGSIRYEGSWPMGRALLFHRRVGDRSNGPWVAITIELH
jgi:hypothetical protein